MLTEHHSDDELELYALDRIRDEAELALVEEHIMSCPGCAQRVEEMDEYVRTIR